MHFHDYPIQMNQQQNCTRNYHFSHNLILVIHTKNKPSKFIATRLHTILLKQCFGYTTI